MTNVGCARKKKNLTVKNFLHPIQDSPRKIQIKVNLLRSQRNRLENQITNLITMSVSAQRVVDQKDAEIQELQKCQNLSSQRENDENEKKSSQKNKK